MALASRPELAQLGALTSASNERIRQEHWRPWLPNLVLGASAGTFGGGMSDTFTNQGSRSDVDALAVWELRNAGFGNHVLRQRRASQWRQRRIELGWMRDLVAQEVRSATADVQSYRQQIEATFEADRNGRPESATQHAKDP